MSRTECSGRWSYLRFRVHLTFCLHEAILNITKYVYNRIWIKGKPVRILEYFSSNVHLWLQNYGTMNITLISGNGGTKAERKNEKLMVKGGTFDYSFFSVYIIV